MDRTSPVVQWIGTGLPTQGLMPGSGGLHMPLKPMPSSACTLQLLSSCAALRKPVCLESVLCKRSYHSEKPVNPNEEQPLLTASRESLCTATKTQCTKTKTWTEINENVT